VLEIYRLLSLDLGSLVFFSVSVVEVVEPAFPNQIEILLTFSFSGQKFQKIVVLDERTFPYTNLIKELWIDKMH